MPIECVLTAIQEYVKYSLEPQATATDVDLRPNSPAV